MVQGQLLNATWGITLSLLCLAASMAVNAMATGLIVFRILKVFFGVEATSVERTLGSLSSTGGTKLQHIVFIVIESAMALFAIQLVRVLITSLGAVAVETPTSIVIALQFVIAIHEMLNVIIKICSNSNFFFFFFFGFY